MSYAPPIDVNTFYSNDDLTDLAERAGRFPWSVHITGIGDLHAHLDVAPAYDGDPGKGEFTQRTALKWASERNAWNDKLRADAGAGPSGVHAVVLHHGEPWAPDPSSDGPVGEYCEWFDFDACEWFCNICFEVIKDGAAHCPTCAPTRFAGLKRLECDADPAHPALFMYADNLDGYGSPGCFYCTLGYQNEVDAERRHAQHRGWYRRLDSWHLLPVLKRLRLVKSWHWTSGSPSMCNGCVSITWRWTR